MIPPEFRHTPPRETLRRTTPSLGFVDVKRSATESRDEPFLLGTDVGRDFPDDVFVLEIALTDLGLLTDTGDLTALSPDEIIARVRGYFKFLGTDLNFEVRDGRLLVSRAPVGEKPADEADRLVDRVWVTKSPSGLEVVDGWPNRLRLV